MFKNAFSFDGRIRRSEYFITRLIFIFILIIVISISSLISEIFPAILIFILVIPSIWFLIALGTKRCHDRGNSGWFQLIPFYGLVMVFGDSEIVDNEYGPNPKGIGNIVDNGEIDTIGKHLE